jgi:hypothetical protein
MAQHTFTYGHGDTETDVTVEISDAIIEAASCAAEEEDRLMTIGQHPVFGWVYRDAEDEAGTAELSNTVTCDAFGLVTGR